MLDGCLKLSYRPSVQRDLSMWDCGIKLENDFSLAWLQGGTGVVIQGRRVSGQSIGRRGVHDACERFRSHALLVPERVGGEENAAGGRNGCFDDGGGDAQPDGGGEGKEGNAGEEVGGADLGGQREAEADLQKEGGEFERELHRKNLEVPSILRLYCRTYVGNHP
jgi:hypothetical protein